MADFYWYGGSGNWTDYTNHWSGNSGNSPSAAKSNAPTSADNVYIDANSFSGTGTITMDAQAYSANFDCTGLAYAVTMSGSVQFNIYGNCTLNSNLTITLGAYIVVLRGSGNTTFTQNSATMSSQRITIFKTSPDKVTFQDTVSVGTIYLDGGELDTNNQSVTCYTFSSSNSTTRTLTLGSSSVTITHTGSVYTVLDLSNYSGLTVNAGTSTLTFTGTGSTLSLYFANATWYNVVFPATTVGVYHQSTFNNITMSGAGSYRITFASNNTINGTLTLSGSSASSRLKCNSTVFGTARTLSCAAVSLSYVDFADITCSGAATWSGTSIGDAGGNTGLTATAPATKYFYCTGTGVKYWNGAYWYTASGGGGSATDMPLPHDTAVFDAASFDAAATLGFNIRSFYPAIDLTNIDQNIAISGSLSDTWVVGDFILKSGMTGSMAGTLQLCGRSTHTLNTQGLAITTLNFYGPGSYTVQSNLTGTGGLIVYSGTVDFNDFNVSHSSFSSSGTVTRSIKLGNGTFTLTSTGSFWNFDTSTGLTFDAEGSTIIHNRAGNSENWTFATGTKTFNKVVFNGTYTTTECSYNITNTPCTINELTTTNPAARRINFLSGATYTFGKFSVVGVSGGLCKLRPVSASNYTLAKSGGSAVSLDYMDLNRVTGSPARTWFAGNHSTDSLNNTDVYFHEPPPKKMMAYSKRR